jgi:hypothetical protein
LSRDVVTERSEGADHAAIWETMVSKAYLPYLRNGKDTNRLEAKLKRKMLGEEQIR